MQGDAADELEDPEEAAVTMGPAQMVNTLAEGEAAYVPSWVSAFSNDHESAEVVPAQWAMLHEKLQEATDLGDTIRNNEFTAKVAGGKFIEDGVHRNLLLRACQASLESLKKLPEQVKDERFEKLCAKVINQTVDAEFEKNAQPQSSTGGRLIVPTGTKPLSLFDWQFWTKFDPVKWWYGDCCWGHPQRPRKYDIPYFVEMCLRREELEYSTAEEETRQEPYQAPPINRWRNDHKALHIMRTVWGMDSKIKSVYAYTHRPGNMKTMASLSKLTPETLAECYATASEHKTIGALMRDDSLPRVLRKALDSMQVATQDVIDTDGHRRLLRHEGNAYSTRFGAMAVFTTPNLPEQRHCTMLLTRGDIDNAERIVNVEAPEMPLLGEMFKMMADDPVGVAFADDLMFRLFVLHVIGARQDCVSFRRGKKPSNLSDKTWIGSAASCTRVGFAGLPRAAVGPLESSGRWALHGHWRIFLHQTDYRRLLELFDKEPETLQANLGAYFTALLSSILSTMQSSVAQLPHLFNDGVTTLPVLPLLRSQGKDFDGKHYTYKSGLEEGDDKQSVLQKPNISQVETYPADSYVPNRNDANKGFKANITGTALSRLPNFRRCGIIRATTRADNDVITVQIEGQDHEAWRKDFSQDAWELTRQSILHTCGPSCWKYNKPKNSNSKTCFRTCRHECEHFVDLPETKNPRPALGRRLRSKVMISEDEQTNMKGRVQLLQTQPYEGRTNYFGLSALRSNWDVQDVRCILPGILEEILPSIGPQEGWSWMTSETPHRLLPLLEHNWDMLFLQLASQERIGDQAVLCLEEMRKMEFLLLEMFIATHHTGYYVNSYTTKPGALLGEFMKHLRVGLERLHLEFQEADEKAKQQAADTGQKKKGTGTSKKAARLLLRLNTAYTRCVHKGGPELVFPMLFGHMCYQTHRCWNVWTKTAVWRALEAWRRSCKQVVRDRLAVNKQPEQMAYAHRGLLSLLPKGWRHHEGGVFSPDDDWFATPQEAYKAFLVQHQVEKILTDEELQHLVETARKNLSYENDTELIEVNGAIVTANQLDDYIHRGDDPVLRDMSLYVYSAWIWRVEKNQEKDKENRQLQFAFRPEYKLAAGYMQQISVSERVPKLDGFTMPPPRKKNKDAITDLEMNNMFKSVILRPMEWFTKNLQDIPDPVSQFYQHHSCPEQPLPAHPWSLDTAFSSAWQAHFEEITA